VLLSHYYYVVTTSMLRFLRIAIRSKTSVKTCAYFFGYSDRHGKSPCFSYVLLRVVNVDRRASFLSSINIHDLL
jgi:arginine/ornithine N-succinyltransferase beta subunit